MALTSVINKSLWRSFY